MICDDVKVAINKIDSELKTLFSSVGVTEKADGARFYFEIPCEGIFENLKVGKSVKAKTIVRINKSDLINFESRPIKWEYLTNPKNESSGFWLERVSNFSNLSNDIYKTISEKRMDSDYLETLDEIEKEVEIFEKSEIGNFLDIFTNFGLNIIKQEHELKKINDLIKKEFYFEFDRDIKTSEKFKIESRVKEISDSYEIVFKENSILIRISLK